MKAFFLFALATFASFISCSLGDFLDLNRHNNIEKADLFFGHFEDSISPRFEAIASNMMGIKEFDVMYSSIVFFCSSVHQQLYNSIVASINDIDFIYNEIMKYFLFTLINQLEDIKSENDWLGEYVEKYAYDLRDAIVVSVKRGLDALNKQYSSSTISRSIPIPFAPILEVSEFEFDEITSEFSQNPEIHRNILSDEEEKSILDEIWNNSARSTSPKPSAELTLAALSMMSYGIRSTDLLFPLVRSFLEFVRDNNLNIVDPRHIFDKSRAQIAYSSGFDISSPRFQDFCDFVGSSDLPETSSLYCGSTLSKSEKLKAKRTVLMELAVENLFKLNDSIESESVFEVLKSKNIVADAEIVELIVFRVKEQVNNFLFLFELSGSLVNGLNSAIDAATTQIIEMIVIESGETLITGIKAILMQHFESPLILIKNYDCLEEWSSHYDESSPSFKTALKPIKRSSSINGNLQSLSIINSRTLSPDGIKYFDCENDFMGCFDDESSFFNCLDGPVLKSKSRALAEIRVPDFPFENPVETIKDPFYIRSTGHYLAQNVDDSCFMLDERIYSMKEGLSMFLSESFGNSAVVEAVQEIIGNGIDETFKNVKNRK